MKTIAHTFHLNFRKVNIMDLKSNKKLILLFLILIGLVLVFVFFNSGPQEETQGPSGPESLTYEETEYLNNINVEEVPVSYFLVKEENGLFYAGDVDLENASSSSPGEVTAKYSGTLTQTDLYDSPGILSVDVEYYSEEKEEDLQEEIPYSLEFMGQKFSGRLDFSGNLDSKLYRGTLERQ